MTEIAKLGRALRAERQRRGWSQRELADRARAIAREAGDEIKLSQQLVNQLELGTPQSVPRWHRFALQAFVAADESAAAHPDLPTEPLVPDYLPVAVMPTFGGMGGGGNGEGDEGLAMLPRLLIEDQLRGKARDFLLIEVRGDSMSPEFLHGDQILIDRRDVDPRQPGPFALFDGDGIVVKLVERLPGRRDHLRVFSANSRYSEYTVQEDEVQIMGRPVWFARAL